MRTILKDNKIKATDAEKFNLILIFLTEELKPILQKGKKITSTMQPRKDPTDGNVYGYEGTLDCSKNRWSVSISTGGTTVRICCTNQNPHVTYISLIKKETDLKKEGKILRAILRK